MEPRFLHELTLICTDSFLAKDATPKPDLIFDRMDKINGINSLDYIPNYSVTVQAHNAAGWGPVSAAVNLGGL